MAFSSRLGHLGARHNVERLRGPRVLALTGNLDEFRDCGRRLLDLLRLQGRSESMSHTYVALRDFWKGGWEEAFESFEKAAAQEHVDWITDCIGYLDEHQLSTIEATEDAEEEWIAHVNGVATGSMMTAHTCNSWYLGANIPGKPRIFMPYVGGVGEYRRRCDEIVANGYEGFLLT